MVPSLDDGGSSFGDRHSAGRQHCMTSDCERAITLTGPTVKRLLCLFHVDQSAWRWLRDGDNGVILDEFHEARLISIIFRWKVFN